MIRSSPAATVEVAVVVPAHDPGDFLERALASVIAQEHEHWKCVVVDDGSTQDLSWVEHLDHRITLIRRPRRGPAAARNAGVAAVGGDHVAFLDADDVWRPDKLARQVALLTAEEGAVLCHSGAEIIDAAGNLVGTWPYARKIQGYADLFQGNGVGTSSVLVRRTSLIEAGGWNQFHRAAEDLDLWLRLSMLGSFVYDDEPLVQYRRHGGNLSGDPSLMASGVDLVLRQYETLAVHDQDEEMQAMIAEARRAARRGWGATAFDRAREARRDHHRSAALRWWIEALRLNPRYTSLTTCRHLVRWPRVRASRPLPLGEP